MIAAYIVLAPIAVAAALAVILVRKPVHAALALALVMLCLAGLYAALEAPFLFVVQIIVYTGAVIMLFLFVVMLVGVDSSDSPVETIPGQRALTVVAGVIFGALLLTAIGRSTLGSSTGLSAANAGGNVEGLAKLLFSTYVLAFEATSALLITAALGAMVLGHRRSLTPKLTQRQQSEQRFKVYAATGAHPGQLPPPGTFARHNANDTPALLPDGSIATSSVSRTLIARGVERNPVPLASEVPQIVREIDAPAEREES